MKILLKGLGPNDKIQYNNNWFTNGAVVDIDSRHAEAYINANLAVEVKSSEDIEEALALQSLEAKNDEKRKELQTKRKSREEVKPE